jgi:PIN domain nuclease of toxin-antitoxin system
MKLLLDTHALLWFLAGSAELSGAARRSIEDLGNERLVSVASLWEMAIKISLGKLSFPTTDSAAVIELLRANRMDILPVAAAHGLGVAQLPFHHRDPFDRLLIAQAVVEGAVIVTGDERFAAYNVRRIW